MYDEILQSVIDMADAAIGESIVIGSMPPDNGIAMIGTSRSDPIFLDIGSNEELDVICNGKNSDQEIVIQKLDAIHKDLTRRKRFPSNGEWQIYSIETIASPRLIGREANSQWIYGSSLLVKINVKGI